MKNHHLVSIKSSFSSALLKWSNFCNFYKLNFPSQEQKIKINVTVGLKGAWDKRPKLKQIVEYKISQYGRENIDIFLHLLIHDGGFFKNFLLLKTPPK